ncbi:MAG: cell wall hydrolase [Paracoccaceae bacterium]
MMTATFRAAAACLAAALTLTTLPAQAANLLDARLDSLLGDRSQALAVAPAAAATAILYPAPVEVGPDTVPLAALAEPDLFDRDWLAAQPTPTGGEQWECLTQALYFEARGEPLAGIYAVGEVILNRVQHRYYPDTLCGVVNEGTGALHACQFSYTCDGIPEHIAEPAAWAKVGRIARLLMDGRVPAMVPGATHYHTKSVDPFWAAVFPRIDTIGYHHFYVETPRA